MKKEAMKTYSLEEMLDKHIGKLGSAVKLSIFLGVPLWLGDFVAGKNRVLGQN